MKGRLDAPLHIAAYFLNPYYFYKDPTIQYESVVMEGFMSCVETFYHGDFDKQDQVVNHEVSFYNNIIGSFGRSLAIKGCETKENFDPGNWWSTHGCGAPIFQRLATRILALTSSSSGCERNWSSFEGIHTKKWNRLDVARLNTLVYIQFNARLFNKQKKIRENNVYVIFDDGNEDTIEDWLVEKRQDIDADTQAPRVRELYDNDFESEEENLLDMEFEGDDMEFDGLFHDIT